MNLRPAECGSPDRSDMLNTSGMKTGRCLAFSSIISSDLPSRERSLGTFGKNALGGCYQPTLASRMGELQERITSTKKGSITSVQAVYVPADDYTDPAPVTIFAHLERYINLSVQLRTGYYPDSGSLPPPRGFWILTSSE